MAVHERGGLPTIPVGNRAAETDPVCGMQVDAGRAADTVVYNGRTFSFCSKHCAQRFREDPARFAAPGASTEPMGAPAGADAKGSYAPLIVVLSLIGAATAALSLRDYYAGELSVRESISYFMTAFFLVFAAFKLMDLRGFADGYSTYDLLARRVYPYGFLYPFMELGFGLTMLYGFQPAWLLWSEFGVMAFSGLGVAMKLARHEKFQCACLGTFLKVPLTNVTLVEDFGMAALALAMLHLTA